MLWKHTPIVKSYSHPYPLLQSPNSIHVAKAVVVFYDKNPATHPVFLRVIPVSIVSLFVTLSVKDEWSGHPTDSNVNKKRTFAMCKLPDKREYYAEKDQLISGLFRTEPRRAFALMFDTYYKPLCLYAVQLTDSFGMAEDIVQELFVSLWEKKALSSVTVSLRGYLFSSVRNNAYLLLRKKNLVSMEELSGMEICIEDSFASEEELREKERTILEELNKLPRQELAAVKAVIMENKKYREAAEEMHISVNTLKTHLSRALKRLRKTDALIYLFGFI